MMRNARSDKQQTRDAFLQIFGFEKVGNLLDSYANTANVATEQLSNLGPSIQESLSGLNGVSDKINSMLGSVMEAFKDIKCTVFDKDITSRLMAIVNILVNMSFADTEARLKCFFWNVFVSFGSDIYKMLVSWCTFKPEHSLQMNFAISDIMTLLGDSTTKLISLPILGSLLAMLLQAILGLPGNVSMTGAIKFFGDRCRSLKNIFDFALGYQYLFEGIVDWLAQNVFGIQMAKTDLDQYLTKFSTWAQDVLDLSNCEDPLAQRLEKDERLVYKVDTLYRQGVKFASDISEKRLDSKMTLYFQKIFKIIEEARKLCDFTGVFGNKPRMEPLVIQLFGESGVGKSGMTWPLSVDLNALFVSSPEEAQNFSNNIYFRNTEQEFWDGYVGQNIVTYDDFGQRTDSGANPNEEFMELIRASNIAPYPLHMAELAEKKRTKFNSKVIILTSNILNHNVGSLTFPDAYRRRIDLCAKVINKPEFVRQGFSNATNQTVKRLNVDLCNGPVDTNVYEMVIYDPETMQAMPGVAHMDYDQFLELAIDKILVKQRRSQAVNTVLSNRITSERFETLRAKLQMMQEMEEPSCTQVFFDASSETVTILECGEAIESYRETISRIAKQLVTFKNVLMTIGLILGGLGIWKLLSKKKPAKYNRWDAFNKSGNSLTGCAQTIKMEATQSGDSITIKPRVIATEASSSGDALTGKTKTIVTEGRYCRCGLENPCCDSIPPPVVDTRNVLERICDYCASFIPDGPNARKPCQHGNVRGLCFICRPILEANQSGDNVTMKNRCIHVEAHQSGDNVTMKNKAINVEAILDTRELERPALDNLQAWRDCTAQDLISTRILSNLYKITRVRGDLPLLNGLFVRDNIMLVPKHIEIMINTADELIIENVFNSRFTLPVSELKFKNITDSIGSDKDAMLVQFPRYVNSHADIVKHFQTMPELSVRNANVSLATIRQYKTERTLVVLGNVMAKFNSITLNTEHGERNIRDCIEYNLNTINGDCGSPVICNEKSFARKIAGIHIAAANDGSSAFAQSVTQKDILTAISFFDKVVVSDMDVLANLQLAHEDHQLAFDKPYTSEAIKKIFGVAADTFSYLGKCAKTVFVPNKTDIRPSTIHNEVTKANTKPAFLKHKEVDILRKNLEKCGVNTPFIPTDEVQRAVNDYKVVLMQKPIESLRRVLTYEESISGNALSIFLSGLSRSTSPGYPWVFEKEPGKHGKTTWFGNDEVYVYDQGVKDRVSRLAELAKQGIRVPYIWTDTLKDERRPIAKVDALKTRVFAAGPMDYLIIFRQYFLGFMANCMENRISNEQSIGTNPFNNDWKRTAKKLSKFGDKVFAGDFSTFDGTLNSCIMSAFVDVINEWYGDSKENQTLRHVLFLDIYNSIHLCGDQFYSCSHSQPSGNPITTILNSFYNSVSMRIAFYRCQKAAGIRGIEFKDVISMVSYGDDNVINFRDDIVDWFNQVEVTKAYETFGMIYTDEAKSGHIVPYKTLSEVAYLKRAFRKEMGVWFAPLELGVCLEMCNWIRDCPSHEAATCDNIEAACRELSVHGKIVFEEWSPKLVKAFYDKTGIYPNVKTYSTYMEDLLAEY